MRLKPSVRGRPRGLLAQPVDDAAAAPPGRQAEQRSGAVAGAVDERGQPRSDRLQLISSLSQRTDRNRVSSIPSRVVGVGAGSHPPPPPPAPGERSATRSLGGHVRDGPVTARDGLLDPGAEPLTDPRAGTDRGPGLGERPAPAPRFGADQPTLTPPQLHLLPRRRQVLDPPYRPVPHPGAEQPRARRRGAASGVGW